jgi:hypothetical protein
VHLVVDSHDILNFYKAEITIVFCNMEKFLVVKRKRLSSSEEHSERVIHPDQVLPCYLRREVHRLVLCAGIMNLI